ncbi:hypothetical protein MERGE_000625 [Pneumocystis wakefieldiae]|uniref:Major surface glycoprotein 2 C-terminal domain-containing protein n=1 Tax=Pneumocystis wakefieldiae TaxID=38082 RepID=A0A899G468_9ASCO|nr:hypothetical protein MERGE_000625 [Pneumocystis wakefieldiae]
MFYPIINRIIAIGVFNLVAFTYGDKNVDLSVRSSQVSTMGSPFEGLVISQEDIYAFILRKDYEDKDKCKGRLEEYCNDLKKIDPELEKVHAKIKEICNDNNKEKKCEEIKEKIKEKLSELEEATDKLNSDLKTSHENCTAEYIENCLFFLRVSSDDFKKNCASFITICSANTYNDVAKEILMKAYSTVSNNVSECNNKMSELCKILAWENDGLMQLCADLKILCLNLGRNINNTCISLNVSFDDNNDEKCHTQLENCYFYMPFCQNVTEKCDQWKNKCGEKNITFKSPGWDFNPIKREATLLEKIGLEDIYKRESDKGIIIGRSSQAGSKSFLSLVSISERSNDMKSYCKTYLKDYCKDFKYLSDEIKDFCDNNLEKNCDELMNVETRCKHFKIESYLNGLSSKFNGEESDFLDWNKLTELPTRQTCIDYSSECLRLPSICKSGIGRLCNNADEACFRNARDAVLNRIFINKSSGAHYDLSFTPDKLIDCQKKVLDVCATLKSHNKEYFSKCILPKEQCLELKRYILFQLKELGKVLDDVRDFPTERDCLELQEKCRDFKGYSSSNDLKCATLDRHCRYLKESEEIRNAFLKRKDDVLKTPENCIKELRKECKGLYKREENFSSVLCFLTEEICKFMIKRTSLECVAFSNNIKNHNIVNKSKNANDTLLEEICMLWDPYCHQYMENCPNLLKKGNNDDEKGVCLQLKENCKPFWDRFQLEDSLTYELKGSLSTTNKCEEALGNYCTKLEEKNHTFYSLCKGSDPIKDSTTELCKKLVKKVKDKCSALTNNQERIKDDLNKKKDKYEKWRKKAEDFIEKTDLLLFELPKNESKQGAPVGSPGTSGKPDSTPNGETNITNGTTNVTIVRRAVIDAAVPKANPNTKVKVKAFDATARALELYLELKEECKPLELDCGFKKECKKSEALCKEIDTLCEVNPLKVNSLHTVISTTITTSTMTTTTTTTSMTITTSTMTTTTTSTMTTTSTTTSTATSTATSTTTESVDGEKVPEQCTFVKTTDIWVTSTSLHTTTMTTTPTVTSTLTLTTIRKCKPTRCTTGSTKETQEE